MNFEDITMGLFHLYSADALASIPIDTEEELRSDVSSTQTWRSFLSGGQRWDIYIIQSAFETLQNYSLVQWRPDQQSYAMHKLVHAWSQDRLGIDQQRQLSFFTLELMGDATSQKGGDPNHQLRLVPHAMANFGVFSRLHESLGEAAQNALNVLDEMEGFMYRIGRWSEAYEMRKYHFRRTETMLGKEHPETLTSMHNLASVLNDQGRYEVAERMYRQVLMLKERVLGKEHPDTLRSMNNLALMLDNQGRYEEAEQMHRQVLTLNEKVLGKEHPHTLASMHNLAFTWKAQDRNAEAMKLMQECIHLRSRTLSTGHPDTLSSIAALVEWQT